MQKKNGISLIVLVITIIVMIILAASVVIALNNTGVIDKASHAVKITDEKQVQDLAALAWAEAYLDESRTDTIENVVKEELEKHGVTDDNWNINVTDTGVTVTSKNNSSNTQQPTSQYQISGIWKFNNIINFPNEWVENVTYTSNNKTYTKMVSIFPEYTVAQIWYDDDPIIAALPEWSWQEMGVGYQTINFGTTPQTVSEEFYNWFTANATKQ